MFIFNKLYHRLKDNITRRRRNRRWLAFSLFFRNTAASLSSFYKPVFLYQVAQTLPLLDTGFTDLQKGMILISFYYLTQRLVSGIINFIQAALTLKIGHQRSLLFGNLFKASWLLCLTYVGTNPWFIVLSAILAGVEIGFYWQSHHTLVCRFSLEQEMGKSLAGFRFLGNFITMLSPFIGATIVSFFGFNYLFYISILLVFVAIGGVTQLELSTEKDEVNLKEYLDWMKEKAFKRLALAQMGRYFYDISVLLWPLFVFLILSDIVKVGHIYTISLFFAMLISLFTGQLLDKKKRIKLPFFLSGGILSVITMLRIFVVSAWDVVIVDSSNRMLDNFYWLVHEKMWFTRGRGSQDFSYFVYREVNRSLGAIVFWALTLSFFLFFRFDWTGLFALGALGVLMSMLIKESKE
jgi:MFS family permease